MTEQEFRSRSFKHSMPYDIVNKRTGERTECLITAVDFDNGTIRMWPIPYDPEMYKYKELWGKLRVLLPAA